MTAAHASYIKMNVTNQMMTVTMMIAGYANNSELETALLLLLLPLTARSKPSKRVQIYGEYSQKKRAPKNSKKIAFTHVLLGFFGLFVFCLFVLFF